MTDNMPNDTKMFCKNIEPESHLTAKRFLSSSSSSPEEEHLALLAMPFSKLDECARIT